MPPKPKRCRLCNAKVPPERKRIVTNETADFCSAECQTECWRRAQMAIKLRGKQAGWRSPYPRQAEHVEDEE